MLGLCTPSTHVGDPSGAHCFGLALVLAICEVAGGRLLLFPFKQINKSKTLKYSILLINKNVAILLNLNGFFHTFFFILLYHSLADLGYGTCTVMLPISNDVLEE